MQICSATMGFSVEGLALSQEETHRLTASSQRTIRLQSAGLSSTTCDWSACWYAVGD